MFLYVKKSLFPSFPIMEYLPTEYRKISVLFISRFPGFFRFRKKIEIIFDGVEFVIKIKIAIKNISVVGKYLIKISYLSYYLFMEIKHSLDAFLTPSLLSSQRNKKGIIIFRSWNWKGAQWRYIIKYLQMIWTLNAQSRLKKIKP